jgi:hypothetical protein
VLNRKPLGGILINSLSLLCAHCLQITAPLSPFGHGPSESPVLAELPNPTGRGLYDRPQFPNRLSLGLTRWHYGFQLANSSAIAECYETGKVPCFTGIPSPKVVV